MKSIYRIAALPAFLLILGAAEPDGPRFTASGDLERPTNYREWIFVTSGLGMNYSAEGAPDPNPSFDNVFVNPAAYRAFVATGTWPDKTMFVLEVRASQSKGSINKGGHFQSTIAAVETEVKQDGKWSFYGFGKDAASGKRFASTASCYGCHAKNGAVDNTFVQFYPTLLRIAQAKGTLTVRPAEQ